MALITDIQVFMRVKQTAKHHSSISSHCIHHSQYSDSLDYHIGFLILITENNPLQLVNSHHLNSLVNLRQKVGLVTSVSLEHEAPKWNVVWYKLLMNQRSKSY